MQYSCLCAFLCVYSAAEAVLNGHSGSILQFHQQQVPRSKLEQVSRHRRRIKVVHSSGLNHECSHHVGGTRCSNPGSIPSGGPMLQFTPSLLQPTFLSLFTVLSVKAQKPDADRLLTLAKVLDVSIKGTIRVV